MNFNQVNATFKKKASKELENSNDAQKSRSLKSPSTISETIDASIDQTSTERVRSATPIAPKHESITQTKDKNAIPIDSQSQTILKDKQDPSSTENIQESTLKPLDIPSSIKEESQEKQSFKPKGGIAMFQSKELFQAISMRQTNQNSTIRGNLKRIEEQIKESLQETIENNETERSKPLKEPQTPRSTSISDTHTYVSWAPSDIDLSEEPNTIERKSPVIVSKDNNTVAQKTISKTITKASNWKDTDELLKVDITPERTYSKVVDELEKANLVLTTTPSSSYHEPNAFETKETHDRTLLVPNDLCFVVSDATHKIHIDTIDMKEGLSIREMRKDSFNCHVEYLEAEEESKLPFVKKLYKILGSTWFCAMRVSIFIIQCYINFE